MTPNNTPDNLNNTQPPFNFDDPRQRLIHERLTRLVGQSAADFYKDACRIMSGTIEPPFTTTTNLVAHMLREVESSLRSVLAPLAIPSSSDKELEQTTEVKTALVTLKISEEEWLALRNKKTSHADGIKAVLLMLDISKDEELGKAWMSLPSEDKGLHSYAHRPGLGTIRPIDNDFRELWAKIETILYGVLDRFEARYLIIFNSLEKLAQKSEPTKSDAAYFVSSVPNNIISHMSFFTKLDNPKWLPLLHAKNVFRDPPPPKYGYENGSRTIRYPFWPAGIYLLKMATVEPATVKNILLEVSETDNDNVKASLLEIAAALPKTERLSLVERIKNWTQAEHSMYVVTKANEVIKKFLNDKEMGAVINISKVLLGLRSTPREPIAIVEGQTYIQSPDVRGRLDEWQYGQFMQKEFRQIAEIDSWAALDLSSELLNDFVSLSYPNRLAGEQAYKDYTCSSRSAIEDHSQNSMHKDIEDHLIEAVRDVAISIVNNDPSKLKEIVSYLRSKRWSVFIRLAMHVVVERDSPDPAIVKELLLDENLVYRCNSES